MQETKKHVNLSDKQGSYVEQLVAHNKEIENAYNNRMVNTIQFKEIVKQIIIGTNSKDLEHKSPATKRFLISLNKQTSKNGILQLVWNARLKGDNLGTV